MQEYANQSCMQNVGFSEMQSFYLGIERLTGCEGRRFVAGECTCASV